MGQEMQLQGAGRAGVLTIAEANTRLADFAQNKLQVPRLVCRLNPAILSAMLYMPLLPCARCMECPAIWNIASLPSACVKDRCAIHMPHMQDSRHD